MRATSWGKTVPPACRRVAWFVVLALGGMPSNALTAETADGTRSETALERFVPTPAQLRDSGRSRGAAAGRVYKARIEPQWFENETHFWYRNDLRDGRREFLLVDAVEGKRQPAFDHARLAQALRDAGVADARADRLPIESLQFRLAENAVTFRAGGKLWRCDRDSYELTEVAAPQTAEPQRSVAPARPDAPRASTRTGDETEVKIVNRTSGEVELFWLDTAGQRRSYGKLAAGQERTQHTYVGHVWEVVDAAGRTLATFEAEDGATAEITGDAPPRAPRRTDFAPRRAGRDVSPDGKWAAFVRDNNVFVRSTDDGHETQLSSDGREGQAYGMLDWSPDSKTLVAYRIEPGEQKEVYLLESSPSGGGRARLHTRPYALPGDKFTAYELNLFHVAERNHIKPAVERVDFGTPRIRWSRDGRTFTYQQVDRGHQRFRLIEIDPRTGASRNLIDEPTETFIWTAHMDSANFRHVTWLENTDEIIYVSERDGWRHLYLIDAQAGAVKNQITQGEWVVRGVDRIDEENRQIWFRASGRNAGQDPYLIHYYRINFDGSGLVALTAGDGNHTIQYSPGRKYLIDTYSRVDLAPVHELRRVADGALVCSLEQADVSELTASGWAPPEVFSAKGRDGTTDIWGIICRPRDFDPTKKYPVIEQIYAGPQGSYVPKSFSSSRRFASLTDLGFIVVQIDGMGTANRSKAFHDVCWKNLKDAGLPDRILWHQAVAAKYPYYDIDRVGIYGGSAGGQNSTAAVLFHPEFYKAAVSGCGCHDNRMDKASWNEQWMGYPVGPQYAACSNIDNAWRLQGKLLLIVGEMDNNVPPESTYRLADALIKAGKDFDLVVVPGAGHGMGGAYGDRRLKDFFIRHLHGVEPPDRNAPRPRDTARSQPAAQVAAAPIVPATEESEPPAKPANLRELDAGSELRGVLERYDADRGSLSRSLGAPSPQRDGRLAAFFQQQLDDLLALDFDALRDDARVDYLLFKNHLERELRQVDLRRQRESEIAALVPFAAEITELDDARRRLEAKSWSQVSTALAALAKQIDAARRRLERIGEDGRPTQSVANRAAAKTDSLRSVLRGWNAFYDGYDPLFTWWMAEPYKAVDRALQDYATFLRQRFVGASSARDGNDIVGDPIGREALRSELAFEMIPYAPEELLELAEKEFAWCEAEMKKAAAEMGLGDDWKAALERVKNDHVEPGKQPELIRALALEAIEYVEKHDLVTVPALCRDSWRMAMMSPERQLVNPFFTGGETISVSYPTGAMPHEAKLMSMRGNNIHFARATVHHELIPGHHLQGYMNDRHRTYRRPFSTAFWTEGWALYWEMLLYERGFPQSPENRVGMLFWRMHRCARIIFSLGFHLEKMTPRECIDFLVDRVGHERDNAVAEVRRSFETNYGPLYQAAYMLGGLQFRALHRELVESGRMTDRQFHDAILRENNVPVEMVRALLTRQPLTRDWRSNWRFYESESMRPSEASGH